MCSIIYYINDEKMMGKEEHNNTAAIIYGFIHYIQEYDSCSIFVWGFLGMRVIIFSFCRSHSNNYGPLCELYISSHLIRYQKKKDPQKVYIYLYIIFESWGTLPRTK